jgi:hypothetical protein
MTAPIIRHDAPPDPRDDPEHPIPSLAVIDVATYKKEGGADLSIIIASPMAADQRSLTRLLDKIEGCLGHILSEQFRMEAGVPTPENTSVIVKVHPDSDRAVWDLIERSKAWAENNQASLRAEALNSYELGEPSN